MDGVATVIRDSHISVPSMTLEECRPVRLPDHNRQASLGGRRLSRQLDVDRCGGGNPRRLGASERGADADVLATGGRSVREHGCCERGVSQKVTKAATGGAHVAPGS